MRFATQFTLSVAMTFTLANPSIAGEKCPSKNHDVAPVLEVKWQVEGQPFQGEYLYRFRLVRSKYNRIRVEYRIFRANLSQYPAKIPT